MSKAHSIKAEGKPNLFTWDLETEYQNVDRSIQNERKTDPDKLETKRTQLKQLKHDVHDIIVSKTITEEQVSQIFDLVRHGQSGVWEQVTTAIERLAHHFHLVKIRLTKELTDADAAYVSKLVTAIGEFYDKSELIETLATLSTNKNQKVRERAITKIFELRLAEMETHLVQWRSNEKSKTLVDLLDFTLKYIHTPKGPLSVSA